MSGVCLCVTCHSGREDKDEWRVRVCVTCHSGREDKDEWRVFVCDLSLRERGQR